MQRDVSNVSTATGTATYGCEGSYASAAPRNLRSKFELTLLKNKRKMPISLFKILGVSFTLFFVGI